MAERARYRSKGLSTRVPTLSFAAEKAMSQSNQQIRSMVNQMSEIFFKDAVNTATVKGAEYGALNAPTAQQIKDASTFGFDITLPGDQDTIFGKAARKSSLAIATDEMEYQAKVNMNAVLLNAQNNNSDPREVAKELDSISNGFASVLDNESPTSAKKMRASLGIYSNAAWNSYTSKYIEKAKKEMLAKFEKNKQILTTEVLPKVIETATPLSQGTLQKPGMSKTYINIFKRDLLSKIPPGASRETIEDIANDFDKSVQSQSVTIFRNSILTNPNKNSIYEKIKKGNIKDLPIAIQNAWNLSDDKEKLIKIAGDAIARDYNDQDREVKRKKLILDQNILKIDKSIGNVLIAMRDGATPDLIENFDQLVQQMQRLDPNKALELLKVKEENSNFNFAITSNQIVVSAIKKKLLFADTTLTQAELNKDLARGALSFKDYQNFSEKLETRLDKDFNNALKEARARIGLPISGFMVSASDKKYNLLSSVEEAMRIERRINPEFNAIQFLDNNYNLIVKNISDLGRQTVLDSLEPYGTVEKVKNLQRQFPKSKIYTKLLKEIKEFNEANPQFRIN